VINELSANSHVNPYTSLTPDFVLDALAETGLMGDGRLTALSSYENRVYQIHLETERTPTQTDGTPVPDSVVAKFYRPAGGPMRKFKRSMTSRQSWWPQKLRWCRL